MLLIVQKLYIFFIVSPLPLCRCRQPLKAWGWDCVEWPESGSVKPDSHPEMQCTVKNLKKVSLYLWALIDLAVSKYQYTRQSIGDTFSSSWMMFAGISLFMILAKMVGSLPALAAPWSAASCAFFTSSEDILTAWSWLPRTLILTWGPSETFDLFNTGWYLSVRYLRLHCRKAQTRGIGTASWRHRIP